MCSRLLRGDAPNVNVGDLGEFALIERLRARLSPGDASLIAGIGDDAAVWASGDGFTIATTDTMVAGVHFFPDTVDLRDVGWKAVAVNVSDIAAMGGEPAFALITLALPPETPVAALDALYDGINEGARAYGVTVVGGDIVSAGELSITAALCGVSARSSDGSPLLLRRDAAGSGELIAVTAPLGASAGGLRVLRDMRARGERAPRSTGGEAATAPPAPRFLLVESHLHPSPRYDAGRIAVQAGIRCGMDISDGLVQDLGHICAASGVSAELRADDVPVADALRSVYPDDARQLALTGGEDYELILVGGEGALQLADGALRRSLDMDEPQLHIVGRITDEPGKRVRVIDATGAEVPIPRGGWDHLRA